jgi:hypothetical protein
MIGGTEIIYKLYDNNIIISHSVIHILLKTHLNKIVNNVSYEDRVGGNHQYKLPGNLFT